VKNILITGIPRSGTSLLTKLLSQQDNVLCFSEPSWLKDIRYPEQTSEEFSYALKDKINHIRKDIKNGYPVTITVKKGTDELPDNYFKRRKNGQQNYKEDKEVFVEHRDDLVIVIKSNTLFTACLFELIKLQEWQIHCVVRDPLYTLMSWRSLDIPISRGEIKIGELYSEEVKKIALEKNIIKRQVLIYRWFVYQYVQCNCSIIDYSEFVKYPKFYLEKILNRSVRKNYKLDNKNDINRYNSIDSELIKKNLKYLNI